ncbi:MAG: hypothetical protein LBU67_03340 [Oscillospiraceae bacterium]|nr:hypothetical protein [Oscillospiraceae bacterium]
MKENLQQKQDTAKAVEIQIVMPLGLEILKIASLNAHHEKPIKSCGWSPGYPVA